MSSWALRVCVRRVCAPPSVGWSLALPPSCVFDVGAGACVYVCACIPACGGAVTPRLVVAKETRRRECEFPHCREACQLVLRVRVKLVARTGERACAAVAGSVRHAVATTRVLTSAPASASACVRAFLRTRAQFRHGWRWLRQRREQHVSPPIAAKRFDFCFALG